MNSKRAQGAERVNAGGKIAMNTWAVALKKKMIFNIYILNNLKIC